MFPVLYSLDSKNKKRVYIIEVENKIIESIINIKHGQLNGNLQNTKKIIKKGKNIGKKNETSHYKQAIFEAESIWKRKKDSGYKEILGFENIKVPLPMLAHDFTKRGKDINFPCYIQPKLDGLRAVYYNGKLYSRNGKEFDLNFITDSLNKFENIIFDGELYSENMPFQDIISCVKNTTVENRTQIKYFIYDVITEEPFENRYNFLKSLLLPNTCIIVKSEICKSVDLVENYLKEYSKLYEGIMLRNLNGVYRSRYRSTDLQKYKLFQDKEYKIIGYFDGKGKEKGLIIFECITTKGKKFNCRPVGDNVQRTEMFKNGDKYIFKFLTVRYQGISKDGIPRFPVGVTIRDYE